MPGVLAAARLMVVRTIAKFALSFLTAGALSQTVVVSLDYATVSEGIRPTKSVAAMAANSMVHTSLPRRLCP